MVVLSLINGLLKNAVPPLLRHMSIREHRGSRLNSGDMTYADEDDTASFPVDNKDVVT